MSHVLHRTVDSPPPLAVSGSGLTLVGADGATFIDASGGAAVACLGHGDTRVVRAITRQAERLAYAHTSLFSNEPAEALAELLVGGEPGGLAHAFFVSSGSEAMEASLKLARQYMIEIGQPERTRFIARRQSYHGNTLGALAAGGNAARRNPYLPLLSDAFSHVSPCFAYHDQHGSDAQYVDHLAAELETEFQRLGPGTVIAFIAETMVGATTGCVGPVPGYFAAMRAVCDRHGALLILDEVMCGMGRTGATHAWERMGVAPDIQAIAKGLGGGYQPIGAMLVAGRVAGALGRGSGVLHHGHTYQAHPVACAAALEVQRIIASDGLIDNVRIMGERLAAGLTTELAQHPHVGDIRGAGLFWAVEIVADRGTKAPFDPALAVHERIKHETVARGLAVYPMGGTVDGVRGDHVILAPPYIATAAEIDTIVERLADAVRASIPS